MQQKVDLKDITHVDTSSFASNTNLAALKTEIGKVDTDKLKTVPDDLAKLSNVEILMIKLIKQIKKLLILQI